MPHDPKTPVLSFISADRMRPYLDACRGEAQATLRLYSWNSSVAGAFWETIGHFEIFLRDALDRRLDERQRRYGRSGTWLDDPARELSSRAWDKVQEARSAVRRKGKPVCHGQIITELPFGFWRFLLARQHQTTLWPDLARAFPGAPNRALHTVERPIAQLHRFRNRIAHHEGVWSYPLADRYRDLLLVLGYIDLEVRAWVERESRVPRVLAARPGLRIPPN